MNVNGWEIWRTEYNTWMAIKGPCDYTVMADTFQELLIKMDQEEENVDYDYNL